MNQKNKIKYLNTLYRSIDKNLLKNYIFLPIQIVLESRVENIKNNLSNNNPYASLLLAVNTIDNYANFYKGVVKNNKNDGDDFVPPHNNCKCVYDQKECNYSSHVFLKIRTHGNNPQKHLSKNKKWEPVFVGETYKNFLKNTGFTKKDQELIYELRCNITHNGFINNFDNLTVTKNEISFKHLKLIDLLSKSLSKLFIEIDNELKNNNFRIEKTSRIIRFLDHFYSIYPKLLINLIEK